MRMDAEIREILASASCKCLKLVVNTRAEDWYQIVLTKAGSLGVNEGPSQIELELSHKLIATDLNCLCACRDRIHALEISIDTGTLWQCLLGTLRQLEKVRSLKLDIGIHCDETPGLLDCLAQMQTLQYLLVWGPEVSRRELAYLARSNTSLEHITFDNESYSDGLVIDELVKDNCSEKQTSTCTVIGAFES